MAFPRCKLAEAVVDAFRFPFLIFNLCNLSFYLAFIIKSVSFVLQPLCMCETCIFVFCLLYC